MLPLQILFIIFLPAAAARRHPFNDLSFPHHHLLQSDAFPVVDTTSFTPTAPSSVSPTIPQLKSRPTTVYRPDSLDALHQYRLRSLHHSQSLVDQLQWNPTEVQGPDIEDRHTLAQLARMAGNAYALPGQKNWYEIDEAWNMSFPFGWEESEGFRGHVFLSSDNSTIVLSIKGTTLQGPTSKLDKYNDNLLFSCCCARVDLSWIFRTVCDCYAKNWRCDSRCLTDALIQDSLFYSIGVKLVDDLLRIYPGSNVWLVGHSLGGALASLLGATYGLPAVAFESPGEHLAASRLHLPLPPPPHNESNPAYSALDHRPIATTHVYHTADPIPQGSCTGFNSPCAQAGYALETHCHLGKTIVFDTVGKLGWAVDVRKHVIRNVVLEVLERDEVEWGEDEDEDSYWWPGKRKDKDTKTKKPGPRRGRDVPRAKVEENCVDCYKWKFGDFKDKPEDL